MGASEYNMVTFCMDTLTGECERRIVLSASVLADTRKIYSTVLKYKCSRI